MIGRTHSDRRPRTAADVAEVVGGRLLACDPRSFVSGASIDSRSTKPGELFFALAGNHCHGAAHADAALAAGAAAVVIDAANVHRLASGTAALVVPDTVSALGRWAAAVRAVERESMPSAAITGSVGKTTVCRYVSELLGGPPRVHRPTSSFNNHLGVPLTILSAPEKAQNLVCEVGTNAPGEVRSLAEIVRPKVVCVTAVAPAHLDGLGSLDAIAREKLSILETISECGEAWVPHAFLERWPQLIANCPGTVRTFAAGASCGADLRIVAAGAERFQLQRRGAAPIPFGWRPPQRHSIEHLEAALGIVDSFGVSAARCLTRRDQLTLPPMRGEVRQHGGVDLVLDCYNSSPVALQSALDEFAERPVSGRRVCVIGTMEELGDEEAFWHHEIGGRLASESFDAVYLVGRATDWLRSGMRAAGGDGEPIRGDGESARRIAAELAPGDGVLFKASRTERLEDLAARVAEDLDAREGDV